MSLEDSYMSWGEDHEDDSSDHPRMIGGGLFGTAALEAINAVRGTAYNIIAPPDSLDQLMTMIDECIARIRESREDHGIKFGIRKSCTNDEPVLMIFNSESDFMYHIHLVNLVDDQEFDIDELVEHLESLSQNTVKRLDLN